MHRAAVSRETIASTVSESIKIARAPMSHIDCDRIAAHLHHKMEIAWRINTRERGGSKGETRPGSPAVRDPSRAGWCGLVANDQYFDTPGTNDDMPAGPADPAPAPRERPKAVSPFDLDKPDKPPTGAPDAPRADRTRPSNQPIDEGGPELSAPDQPIRLGGARTSRYSPEEETNAPDDDGTPLSLPKVTLPPIAGPDTPFGTAPAQAGSMTTDAAPASASPAASAPRRGFLSGLFNNLGWNWTRR